VAGASEARGTGHRAFVSIATGLAAGIGWSARSIPTANIWSMVSTRMTPAWRNRATTATSDEARAPVWLEAARLPAVVRPDLAAMIGLRREMRRAMRENFFGFPNDSR